MTHIRSFVVALALVAAVSLPSVASAASLSDLIAQLTAIQAQLAQLKGQVLGATTDDMQVLPALEPAETTATEETPTDAKSTTAAPLVLPPITEPATATTTAYPAPKVNKPANGSSVIKGSPVPISVSLTQRPEKGAYVETRVFLKSGAPGGSTGIKTQQLTQRHTTGYSLVEMWSTRDFAPGDYVINARLRGCHASGCDRMGKPISPWSKTVKMNVKSPVIASTTPYIDLNVEGTGVGESAEGSVGMYEVELEVTAVEGDIYIPADGSGFIYAITGNAWQGGSRVAVLTSHSAHRVGSYFLINEGEDALFTLSVILDPSVSGKYGIRLDKVQYTTAYNGTQRNYSLSGAEREDATTDLLSLSAEPGEGERSIMVEPVSTDAEVVYTGLPQRGMFEVVFDVTATGDPALISKRNPAILGVFGPGGALKDATYTLTSTAPHLMDSFIVDEDETERFIITASASAEKTGPHRLELKGLQHSYNGKIAVYGLGGSDYTTSSIMLIAGTTTASTTAKGAFTKKTLSAKTENPTIRGTASGTDTVGFSIGRGDKIYGSGDIKVNKKGKWSHKITEDLESGQYTIALYADSVKIAEGFLTVLLPEDKVASKMAIVVGVYEGSYPGGRQRNDTREGTVIVNVMANHTSPPQPLVLSAYEKTNWIINTPDNARISKIITVGYKDQRVSGPLTDIIPTEHYSFEKNKTFYNAYEWKGQGYDALVKWAAQKAGAYSGVFYGSYTGSSFDIEYGWKG